MSSTNRRDRAKESPSNPNLKSSIVHKPFATGTVNIFNPYRNKYSDRSPTSPTSSNAKLNLETASAEPQAEAVYDDRYDSLINSWTIMAIAIVLLANLLSGAAIWRNHVRANSVRKSEPSPNSVDLSAAEFVPLNLGTLSMLKTVEDSPEVLLTPITPAQAPLNNISTSAVDSEYYYVLTEYTGDHSISRSRQKVEQVALVNLPQGTFIYLGAFTAREQADKFVVRLLKEGFAARVYPSY